MMTMLSDIIRGTHSMILPLRAVLVLQQQQQQTYNTAIAHSLHDLMAVIQITQHTPKFIYEA